MGKIVFAAPGIDRFHLHERLRRELQQHGHSVVVLCLDRVAHTFWKHQEGSASLVERGPAMSLRAPLEELAERECLRLGLDDQPAIRRRRQRAIQHRLAQLVPGLLRWFEAERPDLVLLHQNRSAEHALVQWVAQEVGTRILWTGDGLLPHTLQVDERGLDGEAAAGLRHAGDYRAVDNEPGLLQACLTNLLARTIPCALTRRDLAVPPTRERLHDALAALLDGRVRELGACLAAWRRALPTQPFAASLPFTLPGEPFVTALLQDEQDERLRLDATAPPSARQLVAAALAAASGIDPQLRVVVVVPWQALPRHAFDGLDGRERLHFVPATAAPEAAATAIATITTNHPLAAAALLASTPVLHTGRALYGLRGVTTQVPTAGLAAALPTALTEDHATLRQRFLSWLFGYGHLWCSSSHPDHNGLAGFVRTIEARLAERSATGLQLRYRAGPAWPLASEVRPT